MGSPHHCIPPDILYVMQEVAADARDIVESAPSTLSSQLALEGTDLDADWAEAEAASLGRLTTTGGGRQAGMF
jgi:hypothetical protein